MPPEPEVIKQPTGMGRDARVYLEAHGLMPVTPSIRSSDYESALRDPFRYYLTRRLGLAPALRWSQALCRGSWFHTRLQYWNLTEDEATHKVNQILEIRMDELKGLATQLGISGTGLESLREREERDCRSACGWFEACFPLPIGEGRSMKSRLKQSHWRTLGTELRVTVPHGKHLHVAQFDILLYHITQNTLWILDAKTCSEPTIIRLATCTQEFQTQHYMHILKEVIPLLCEKYSLPEDVRVGGMMHWAVQKPSISLSNMDRDCEEYPHELTRGPRKGQIEIRRNYFGEPRFENYVERCAHWYRATGMYESEAANRRDNPPSNVSYSYGSLLHDSTWVDMYRRRVAHVEHAAGSVPEPAQYLSSTRGLINYGVLDPYAPFYLTPVKDWPEIIQREQFTVQHRDDPNEKHETLIQEI